MNYAISLLKHLSARLIINGWLPVEDRQMRWTSHQIGFFSISLIQLGCLPFCMQIVFDYGVLYSLLWFLSYQTTSSPVSENAAVVSDIMKWQWFEKSSCPSSSAFITTLFFSVYLSVTDKSRFGPNRLWGLALSSGHVGCQGAHKCPVALRSCQWKRYY